MLDLVAEQTGYPRDMLDLDLDLEADLGIDTVKQAEMFAADPRGATASRATTTSSCATTRRCPRDRVRVRPAPARDRRPTPHAAAPMRRRDRGCGRRARSRPPPRRRRDAVAAVLEIVAREDRLPADMLDLDLDLEADLGIDTVKQAEMFAAIREALRHPARRQRSSCATTRRCAT